MNSRVSSVSVGIAMYNVVLRLSVINNAYGIDTNVIKKTNDDLVPCGPMALSVLFELEGISVHPHSINARLPQRSEHSMEELRIAAAEFNVSLTGVIYRKEAFQIDRLDRPAIIHLDRVGSGHFVVLRPVGHSGHLVQLIDPIRGVEVIEVSRLVSMRSWNGSALIPSRIKDGLLSGGIVSTAGMVTVWCAAGLAILAWRKASAKTLQKRI